MKEEICPLLSFSDKKISCLKNDCKWFYQSEGQIKGRGSCVVQLLNFNLSLIEKQLRYINKK